MGTGLRTGKVQWSAGFLLLAAWLLYQKGTGLVLQGGAACVLHELGHILVLTQLGVDIKGIRITVFGAQIMLEDDLSYGQELIASAAGPVTNLLLACAARRVPGLECFGGMNLVLALFNLLPVGSLDGARMVRCVLAASLSDGAAYRVGRCLDFSFTVLFGLLGLALAGRGGNMTLLLMCLWILNRPATGKNFRFHQKRRN